MQTDAATSSSTVLKNDGRRTTFGSFGMCVVVPNHSFGIWVA